MKPIAIFYHCLFFMDSPDNLLDDSCLIVKEQMDQLRLSGLMQAATEFQAGINGGLESRQVANLLFPAKVGIRLHGLQCHTENRTIEMIEQWLPGHEDWNVLYFHAKGATHPAGHSFSTTWRRCMMKNSVVNWRKCVSDLDSGYEAVGSHWMEPPATPDGQYIFAGNFWWAKASFLRTLPPIAIRDRIKLSGLDSAESRYESEVWIGNGPKPPKIKDYHGPNWNPGKIETCL